MPFNLMRAVCSSSLWRGMLLGKSPRDRQAKSWSIQAVGMGITVLLRSWCKHIRVPYPANVHLQCSQMSASERIICPGKPPVRALVKSAFLVCLIVLSTCNARRGFAQFGIPGLGGKSGQSNDQKANQLLHQHLPLVLDANNAYPTVPDQNMLGGPFHPRTLPITLDTLTKPLPPGDYVLPMTFFCSEYSVHRGGNGIAYQLGPAQGTAAKAISTLLWRGMLTGHKPQELQSVSWAIQGSVAYDKMPPKYRALVDQLIPEMKNQVNGQAFADIEDGFQGKVNKITKKISEGIGKGTGGFVHADIKVDVELNQSFQRLGQVGRSALDGEKLNTIFTAAFPSDEARDQALYAGQGQQTAALPAANGPWSVKVPGVAYMRFMVHGGNLQGDNVMQIRILPPRTSQARVDERPHLILAGYEQNQQSTPSSPSVISLFNGSVNEAALSQCQATPVNQQVCTAQAINMNGEMCYSIGTGAQACIATPAQPLPATASPQRVCVKKVLYQPTDLYPNADLNTDTIRGAIKDGIGKLQNPSVTLDESLGLCIYLAVIADDGQSCSGQTTAEIPTGEKLNWVQTFEANYDRPECSRQSCKDGGPGPLYRPGDSNNIFEEGSDFESWKAKLAPLGSLQLIFRDIPQRPIHNGTHPGVEVNKFNWATAADEHAKNSIDNHLRLVSYKEGQEVGYTPLIEITYGVHFSQLQGGNIYTDPLTIGGHVTVVPLNEDIQYLRADYRNLPAACTNTKSKVLGPPPDFQVPLP